MGWPIPNVYKMLQRLGHKRASEADSRPADHQTLCHSVKNVGTMGQKALTLKQHIEHTLGTGSMQDAVRLPRGEDLNEWLAVNTVFYYNALNVLYQVLDGDLCTQQRCPIMSAGPQVRWERQALGTCRSQPLDTHSSGYCAIRTDIGQCIVERMCTKQR